MPVCAEVNMAMHGLSGAKYITREQNKEMGKTRQHRDMKDTHTLLLTGKTVQVDPQLFFQRLIVASIALAGEYYRRSSPAPWVVAG